MLRKYLDEERSKMLDVIFERYHSAEPGKKHPPFQLYLDIGYLYGVIFYLLDKLESKG